MKTHEIVINTLLVAFLTLGVTMKFVTGKIEVGIWMLIAIVWLIMSIMLMIALRKLRKESDDHFDRLVKIAEDSQNEMTRTFKVNNDLRTEILGLRKSHSLLHKELNASFIEKKKLEFQLNAKPLKVKSEKKK